jgi:parallel beta-helix repeat protein
MLFLQLNLIGVGERIELLRKTVSGIMLSLVLISTLTLAFNIQPVKASGTIYIRADGSVEGTTSIQTADNVTYVFIANIYDSLVVERNNIIIDGNGYTLQGTGEYDSKGVDLSGRTNVTAHNATIKAFSYGICLDGSSNNTVSGNNITANNGYGILLDFSSNNMIYHNNLDNSQQVASVESMNVWDDGYPSGGNYWSDYSGVDLKNGSGQNQTGSDGIGDTPYIIDADNIDHYPLMYPYSAPPSLTYTLTTSTTVGGTTNPSPGTYSYTANSTVQVRAIPNANYLLDHWELDTINVGSANPYTVLMNKNHTLKAIFSHIKPSVPVGGYSISIQVQTKTEPVLPYVALIAALTAIFTKLRPKTKRKR